MHPYQLRCTAAFNKANCGYDLRNEVTYPAKATAFSQAEIPVSGHPSFIIIDL